MRTSSCIIAAAVAAAAMTAAAAASAQSASTATLSNFTYQLVDLEPNDGITPYVRFTEHGDAALLVLFDTFQTKYPAAVERTLVGNGTSEASTEYGWGKVSMSDEYQSSSIAIGYYHGYATSDRKVDFVLSPNTKLIVSATAAIDQSGASATASILGTYGDRGSADHYAWFYKGNTWEGGTGVLTGELWSPEHEVTGRLALHTESSGFSFIPSAVPEPGSLAMLLTGMGLLAGLMRRVRTS